ncbi:MAG: D-galactarate dehydratase [Rhodobacterales bacterium]|nr:D-galactarate dehydratase [Rhodobacterales bacterium]
MKKMLVLGFIGLAGCDDPAFQEFFGAPASGVAPAEAIAVSAVPPETTIVAPPPPPSARTVEQFDTTTQADRIAAVAAPPPPREARLGTTIASLGSPTDPGIWMRTGLVSEVTMGRVEYPANGKSVTLELRPSGGPAGAGSQISLAAMRLLEVPLTGLPELVVFR